MNPGRTTRLQRLVVTLDQTRDAGEFVRVWRELESLKASFDWGQPSVRELELISEADCIIFRRSDVQARIIRLGEGLRGVITMASLLAILPAMVAIMVGVITAFRGRPWLETTLVTFVAVYSAAAVHEFGHWAGMQRWGRPVAIYGRMPFSSVRLRFKASLTTISAVQLAWMYAAGIAFNLALGLLATVGALALGVSWLWYVAMTNGLLAIINSLPLSLWSSDGATLLRMARSIRAEKKSTEAYKMNDILGTYKPRRTLKPWTRSEDGIVVYMLGPTVRAVENDEIKCCRLNHSCAEIWELCDGDHSVDDIIRVIAERYDMEQSEVLEAVKEGLFVLGEQECVVLDHTPFF